MASFLLVIFKKNIPKNMKPLGKQPVSSSLLLRLEILSLTGFFIQAFERRTHTSKKIEKLETKIPSLPIFTPNLYIYISSFKQKIISIPISMAHPWRTSPTTNPPDQCWPPWYKGSLEAAQVQLGISSHQKKKARYVPLNPACLMNKDPFLSWFIIDNPDITG